MKNIKLFALAATALVMGMTSCSKDNDTTPVDKGVVGTVEVRVKGADFTRTAGTEEVGVGQENEITEWYAFARNADNANYTCAKAVEGKATFKLVPVGSTVYVVANPATGANGVLGTLTDGQNDVSKADIEGLVEKVDKAALQANTAALQIDVTNPQVNPMLMSGSATIANTADPTDSEKVKVTVKIEREYAKVNMAVLPAAGTSITNPNAASESITIDAITQISAYRVVKRISPFTMFHGTNNTDLTGNAEWFIKKTPYTGDKTPNVGPADEESSDFVFNYTPATDAKQSFYVTPNYAKVQAYATAVIVEAEVSGTWNALTYDHDKRYYRAFVFDNEITDEMGITLKNAIYNITGTILGIGEGTPGEALDKDNVNLNVYVEVKPWALRIVNVDME